MVYGPEIEENDPYWLKEGLIVSNSGFEALGTPIGTDDYVNMKTKANYEKIVELVSHLITISKTNPQAAFSLMTKSIQFKAIHLCRTVKDSWRQADKYDMAIKTLLNSIVGCKLSDEKEKKASLPVKQGGLGLSFVSKDYADDQYETSKSLTCASVSAIIENREQPDTSSANEFKSNLMTRRNGRYANSW